MRLLYFDFELPYLINDADMPVGGAAVEWSNWIKGFVENGHELGVMTWKGAEQYVSDSDIPFEWVETYSNNEGIRYIRTFTLRLPRLISAIRYFKPDVVIKGCASLSTGLICMAAKICNVPFVYRAANDMDADNRYKQRMSKLEAKMYDYGITNSAAIVCQNQYQYDMFSRNFPKKKITTIYNPYNIDSLSNNSNCQKREYVAWLGVFQKQKNLPALYEIVKQLPNVHFRIGGKKASKGVDLETEKALNKLEESPNVTFEGYIKRTEVSKFLSGAKLLLNTSHYEGFSNTFLESFASGTPIVTTRMVDPDNIIERHSLGEIAATHDDLAELVMKVVESQNYESLSDKCFSYLIKNHSHIDLSDRFHSFLKEAI